MEPQGIKRKLTTILAADVVGYSRLMSADEEATLKTLSAYRQIIDDLIARHDGRLFGAAGDSVLAEFGSAVEAVRCALAIQKELATRDAELADERRMRYRIGINLGDVMIDGENLLGDGVNVAARLEGLAEPGGICISGDVYRQVRGKLEVGFDDMGGQQVKNIAQPIPAYHVLIDSKAPGKPVVEPPKSNRSWRRQVFVAATVLVLVAAGIMFWLRPWQSSIEAASIERMSFPLPDKPSIAVLPFKNMSGDKDQEYFADGITEDIITDISKIAGIFVVARNSTFPYKDKAVKVRQVAEELGVRYVLQGSVRRAGGKLRITAQLIDAIKARHLWADRYDREVKDVFAVQTEVTQRVVKAMAVTLKADELERIYRRHTTNIEAYELFLRARSTVLTPSKKNVDFAEKLFTRAIELDPNFAGGYAGLSLNHSMKARFRYGTSPQFDRKRSLELAKRAIQVDKDFAWSYIALGGAYLANGDPDSAVDSVRQALVIKPNGYEENLWMGFFSHFAGQPAHAVERLERANRISPADTVRKISFLAMAYFMNGNYSKSVELWRRRIQNYPVGNPIPYVFLSAALVLLEKTDDAATVAAKFRELNPGFRLTNWRYIDSYKSVENRKRLYDAAKRAGIPE